MTGFTPPTYADAHPDHDGTKVACDGCKRKVHTFLLVDYRALDGVTGNWLCDGCRSTLHRTLTPVDGLEAPQTRKEWRERHLKAHGAPEEVLAKVRAMRDTGKDRDRKKGKGE